jgi:hypothetical protein
MSGITRMDEGMSALLRAAREKARAKKSGLTVC